MGHLSLNNRYENLVLLIDRRKKYEEAHPTVENSKFKTDVNYFDINGYTLLHYAAELGHLDQVKKYLAEGASIDCVYECDVVNLDSAITLALKKGHLDVVRYLYLQGANCSKIDSSMCGNEATRQWFQEKLEQLLKDAFPALNNGQLFEEDQQFFKRIKKGALVWREYISILKRAVELGNFDFIQRYRQVVSKQVFQEKATDENLLIVAAQFGQLAILQFLENEGVKLNKPYIKNELHTAIVHNQTAIVEYLISKQVDINKQNNIKNTPVMTAVISDNRIFFEILLAKNADINKINVDGESILHLAAKVENPNFIEQILRIPRAKDLLNIKNIYGHTALDIALEKRNDLVIRCLLPNENSMDIKKHERYGKKAIVIHQKRIMAKMIYYLKSQYRSTEFFSIRGHCNGFTFLHEFYEAKGMENYFFSTLELMSKWDGREETLNKPFSDVEMQKKYYRNLGELFEQWINDIIWFQQSDLGDEISQLDRIKQYNIVDDTEQYRPIIFCNFIGENYEQIKEVLYYFSKMPKGARIEFSGNGHATGGSNQTNINYFDPNFKYKIDRMNSINKLLRLMVDYKYIIFGQSEIDIHEKLQLYYFKNDLQKINWLDFQILSGNELPSSREEAEDFQLKSSNKFTPLHVAVMTRSLSSLKQLLKDNYCDIHAKNVHKKTALDMAVENNFMSGFEQLFYYQKENIDLNYLMVKAYNKSENILEFLLNFDGVNVDYLFFICVRNNDIKLAMRLLEDKKVNINKIYDESLPIIEALNNNNEKMIKYLLDYGAIITMAYSSDKTPLSYVIEKKPHYVSILLSKLNNIYEPDSLGKSLIFYAGHAGKVEIFRSLLEYKSDLLAQEDSNQLLLILQDLTSNNIFGRNKRLACLSVLLENIKGKLLIPQHLNIKKYLRTLLFSYCEENYSDELYKKIIENVDKIALNIRSEDGKFLLQKAASSISKMKLLLQAGADPNIILNSGDTLLIRIMRLPESNERNDLIHLLLDYHVDVSLKSNKGESALDVAINSTDEGIKKIFFETKSQDEVMLKN